jgi:ribonuclease R
MEQKISEVTGRYEATGRGYGFLIPEGGGEDFFLPPRAEAGAWNGDIVRARPDGQEAAEGRRTAAVTDIVERRNKTVTGVLYRRGREVWLAPDSDRLPSAIRVVGRRAGARGGDRAALTITSFGGRGARPMGVLNEVFGRSDSLEAISSAILFNYGISPLFSPEALREAERAPLAVPPEALGGRLDLRGKTVITIDGASAKDLDDAVSLERDESGRAVLGVHIADVSHYVPMGCALDREAWERGTSVYYADKVVPMLPPELSTGICSLSPDTDRLTLSCFMTLDEAGQVVGHTLAKSVIHSRRRMTYANCNILLSDGDPALAETYADILPMLRDMAKIAAALRKKRMLRGALDLETREVYIVCDESGAPVGVGNREQGVSESLIEESLCFSPTRRWPNTFFPFISPRFTGCTKNRRRTRPRRCAPCSGPWVTTCPTPTIFPCRRCFSRPKGGRRPLSCTCWCCAPS